MDINRVELRGNLGKDPEIFEPTTDRGLMVKLSLATNIRYRDRSGKEVEQTEWHNIVCFDWSAEVARTFRKGIKVSLEGYLRNRTYENEQGKRTVVEVVVRDLHEVKAPPRNESQADSTPARHSNDAPASAEPNYH